MDTVVHDPLTGVSLRTITSENIYAVLDLKVAPGQESFVATNAKSLAEAYVEPSFRPFAVYHADAPVGFAMYGREESTGRWWVVRLLIDAAHQRRGYGRAAMRLLIPLMVEREGIDTIVTSYEPGNEHAAALYRSLGFRDTGTLDEGEWLMVLALADWRPDAPAVTMEGHGR